LPKRRSSAHELELQKEITTLQLKLLRVNSALAIKTPIRQQTGYLLHQRSETIDALHGQLEQSREQIRRLDLECEHLADMIRIMPQLDPAMLAPK
jgi:hypothetical protein